MFEKKFALYDASMNRFDIFLEDLHANLKHLPKTKQDALEWLQAVIYDAVLCGEEIESEND